MAYASVLGHKDDQSAVGAKLCLHHLIKYPFIGAFVTLNARQNVLQKSRPVITFMSWYTGDGFIDKLWKYKYIEVWCNLGWVLLRQSHNYKGECRMCSSEYYLKKTKVWEWQRINCRATFKGRGHGKFHNALLVPVLG